MPVLHGTEGDQDANRVVAWPKAVRDGDWKLVMHNKKKPELFHVSRDRNEKKNLAAEFPERVHKMKQLHSKLFSMNKEQRMIVKLNQDREGQ